MRLSELIQQRRRQTGDSYRDMEKRAHDAGEPISRSRLSTYGSPGRLAAVPSEETRRALAAALDVTVEEVTAAALESAGVDSMASQGRDTQRAEAWLRLTAGRTEREVEQLLGVVEATLRAMGAPKDD